MVERYKEVLDKAKNTKFEVLTTWFHFQMKKDPFLTPIGKEDINYFVGREEIIEDIIFQIGVAARGIPNTVLLVGPYGSGKTSVVNYVKNIIEKIGDDSPKKYGLKGDVFSTDYLFGLPDEIDDEVQETQPWLKQAGKDRDFLLIDDAKPNHVKAINREFVKSKLKLFSLSPLDLDEVMSSLQFTPKVIFLKPLSFEDSVEMLEKRIQIAMENLGKSFSIEKLFKTKTLKIIWNCSMGIPLLILQNCSKALELVANLKTQMVTEDIVRRACEITKSLKAEQRMKKLTKTKIELVDTVIETGRSPTELSSILQKDRTTISRQLNELKRQGLVEIRYIGRESIYKTTLPARIAYELRRIPEVR